MDLGKHGWWHPPDVRLEFCSEYQQVPASTKKDQKAQKITKKVKQTPNEVPKKMLVVQTNRLSAYRTCTALTSKGSRWLDFLRKASLRFPPIVFLWKFTFWFSGLIGMCWRVTSVSFELGYTARVWPTNSTVVLSSSCRKGPFVQSFTQNVSFSVFCTDFWGISEVVFIVHPSQSLTQWNFIILQSGEL